MNESLDSMERSYVKQATFSKSYWEKGSLFY